MALREGDEVAEAARQRLSSFDSTMLCQNALRNMTVATCGSDRSASLRNLPCPLVPYGLLSYFQGSSIQIAFAKTQGLLLYEKYDQTYHTYAIRPVEDA